MDSTSQLLNYYKNVIEYSDLTEVNVLAENREGKYPNGGYVITQQDILSGQVDKTTLSKLFGDSKDNLIDVTIAFDSFKYGRVFKAAMWVTASLKRDGNLSISEFPSFTIAKSYLSPFVNNISVGSSWNEFAAAQDSYRLGDMEEWKDYIGAILSIKRSIIKKTEIEFNGIKRPVNDTKNYIFYGNMIAKINAHILSIYKEATEHESKKSELSKKIAKVALEENTHKKEAKITLTPKLSGALPSTEFIPNFEQWRGIETVLKSEKGEMTAIQGPPGTGKTSLVQFVIASEIVNSVCSNDDYPKLTTICSTNNQAVTNAVESLAIDSSDRWLEIEIGLGMYLPANSRQTEIPNVTINKSSTNDKFYVNSSYLEPFFQYPQFLKIKKDFLESAKKNLEINEDVSLYEIRKKLRGKVLTSQGRLKFSCFTSKAMTIINNGTLGFFLRNRKNYYDILKKSYWDEHLKFMKESFINALHYWEACFIEEIDELFTHRDKNRKLAFESSFEAIKTISLLTPFFGMTLHQLAKHFGADNNPEIKLESIELLILDESGQICPELGFFSLLLAQKALIVGDSMQLEPIHAISENEDTRLVKEKKEIKNYFTSSRGNFMDLADTSADYSSCLLEHYRCHSDIISISNELCYEDKLISRTSSEHGLYPPLSFLDIYGVCKKSSSGSLSNNEESSLIVSWISHEKDKIEKYYEEEIENLIAVVTPFKKQSDDISRGLTKNGIEGVVVGTVHKLQGAEFPIVIFAPTYTAEYIRAHLESRGDLMFFDISPSMINVAVSRAKKSFIYAGDPRILNYANENEILPSQILSRHLRENATPLNYHGGSTSLAKLHDDVERISSLEEHRAILKQAFQDAQDCISISSPFITASAIREDSIERKIREAVNRGVKVKIFYDSQLNNKRTDIQKSIALLEKAGAKVIHRNRLHSKVLYIDNKMIIESSFNWLSAVRYKSEYQRYESSLVYRGEFASKMIANVEREL